jgi:broad specificity phosphatase PhoE
LRSKDISNKLTGKIVLGRHGQTVANRDGFIMGRSDAPLTHKGIETARKVAESIGREGVQRIVASSLGRAAFTAAIYSQLLRIPVSFTENMAELSCGSWEGRSRAEVLGGSNMIRKTWMVRPPGGESYQDAEARVVTAIDKIRGVTGTGPILVVGHATVNRVFLKLWLDVDPDTALWIRSPHDTIYVMEQGDRVRHVAGNGTKGYGFLRETE